MTFTFYPLNVKKLGLNFFFFFYWQYIFDKTFSSNSYAIGRLDLRISQRHEPLRKKKCLLVWTARRKAAARRENAGDILGAELGHFLLERPQVRAELQADELVLDNDQLVAGGDHRLDAGLLVYARHEHVAGGGLARPDRQHAEGERGAGGHGRDEAALEERQAALPEQVQSEQVGELAEDARAHRLRLHFEQVAGATQAVRQVVVAARNQRREEAAFAFAKARVLREVVAVHEREVAEQELDALLGPAFFGKFALSIDILIEFLGLGGDCYSQYDLGLLR